jgi:hypothetical protein
LWNENGTLLWNSSWSLGGNFGHVNSIWGTNNYLYLCGSYQTEMLLLKYHLNGTFLWNQTWGGAGLETGLDVWGINQTIFTCGSTSSYGAGLSDGVVVKWDTTGSIIWYDTWGTEYHENYTSIFGYEDNIYVCGGAWNNKKGATDVLITKWNSNGTRIWNRKTGRDLDDFGYSIWANEYYVYICGLTHNDALEHSRILFVKYTYSGVRDERKTYGTKTTEDIGKAIFVSNENLYIGGIYGIHQNQILLNYFSLPTPQPPDFKNLSPNPSLNGTFLIEWKKVAGAESYNLYRDIHPILDISNRTVYQSLLNTNFTEVGLEEGTYFYVLTTIFKGVESVMSGPGIILVDYPNLPRRRIHGYGVISIITIMGLSMIFLISSVQRKLL